MSQGLQDRFDVVVVGAGPAGSTVATELAREGMSVIVLEEHATVGSPVHCTGLTSEQMLSDFDLPEDLVRVRGQAMTIWGPRGAQLAWPDTPAAGWVVLDRGGLDRLLAERAAAAGARVVCSARVRGLTQQDGGVTVWLAPSLRGADPSLPSCIEATVCVLACGSMSPLPARAGLVEGRGWYRSAQATVVSGVAGAEVFLGGVTPASFGYVAALGAGRARLGVLTRDDPRPAFYALHQQAVGRGLAAPGLVRPQLRRIPMGAPRCVHLGHVVCVGDAAGQAKTTTAGGIYYAMLCARDLAGALREGLRGGGVASGLVAYERAWRARLEGELRLGVRLRYSLEAVGDAAIDALLRAASRSGAQQVLRRVLSFDFHRDALLALLGQPGMTTLLDPSQGRAGAIAGAEAGAPRLLGRALQGARLLLKGGA